MEDELKKILATYNSVSPSRRRWVRNRSQLRNQWKELFQVLENASGRDASKNVAVYDENWHELADKGSARGAVNRDVEDVDIASLSVEAKESKPSVSLAEQNGEADKPTHAEELRALSIRDTKLGEKEKNIKTTPAHVAMPGEKEEGIQDGREGDRPAKSSDGVDNGDGFHDTVNDENAVVGAQNEEPVETVSDTPQDDALKEAEVSEEKSEKAKTQTVRTRDAVNSVSKKKETGADEPKDQKS